jgi:2-polyprenyl-3-methyl-5-hydroxy-6-metoxy-1,4-benzoquinol methylase
VTGIALAATWHPRGEQNRFRRLARTLLDEYAWLVISLPPQISHDELEEIQNIQGYGSGSGRVMTVVNPDWSWGRYTALQKSLETPADFIQYADFDRLLRWVETRPQEWRRVLQQIQVWDCLVIGRTPEAYATHPRALTATEETSNRIVSFFLGEQVDASAGSKGFSRRAVEFLIQNTKPGHPFGADAEWLILLKRSGFRFGSIQVDGLEWESADRYKDRAVTTLEQEQAAKAYDADPANWLHRVQVAQEVVEGSLQAFQHNLVEVPERLFDFEATFDVDDYLYFYEDNLTSERTESEVEFIVREMGMDYPMDVLDLACGFGRHANSMAALGHRVTGIDLTQGFLEIALNQAAAMGVQVDYRLGDMRTLSDQASYDRIVSFFTAFGYYSDQENQQILCNIARALRPGGLFLLDIQNRDRLIKMLMPFIVTEKEGNLMIDRQTYDPISGRLYNRRVVIRNGIRRDKPFFVRLYSVPEICESLRQAGLQVVKILGGLDDSPFTVESRRMIVIATTANDLEA